ncbi:hypothetical protein OH76DRAFT_615404 [Lentinus brumalis]|uniref:Uncharacterized protein n=1 Tax=Lentinus brumalis TaxID=2498619 RepID=A0A371D8U1_9APHY|nr:hypothetical protein OH76DRAFT_615404 [Polyporus brumalis]
MPRLRAAPSSPPPSRRLRACSARSLAFSRPPAHRCRPCQASCPAMRRQVQPLARSRARCPVRSPPSPPSRRRVSARRCRLCRPQSPPWRLPRLPRRQALPLPQRRVRPTFQSVCPYSGQASPHRRHSLEECTSTTRTEMAVSKCMLVTADVFRARISCVYSSSDTSDRQNVFEEWTSAIRSVFVASKCTPWLHAFQHASGRVYGRAAPL